MARQFGGMHSGQQFDRAKIVLAAGGVLVLLFLGLAYVLLSSSSTPDQNANTASVNPVTDQGQDVKMLEVLIPVQEIPHGTELEAHMFRKEARPQVGVSNRVVTDFEEIKGQYARTLVVPNQPLHRDYITAVKPTNILTSTIPDGYRAVTIRVDARTSVEGFTRPGARVDVVWTSTVSGKAAITTIVENAKVLSAERQTENNQKGAPVPNTITLMVTAEDAQKIQLASTTGTLSLSLRGDTDSGRTTTTRTITIEDLTGRTAAGAKHQRENVEGTVTIGGEKWLLVDGKLVPATPANR